jgi:alkyl hydroperoxide reductase subunit AhpC
MLTVGDRIPSFDLQSVISTEQDKAFTRISDQSDKGNWKVIFFWPKDFTFVCPTEIAAFGKLNREFNDRDAVVYGASTDSEFVHLAWRRSHADLKDLRFASVHDLSVGRNVDEVLRTLDALQSDELCPCNWQKGDKFLKAA